MKPFLSNLLFDSFSSWLISSSCELRITFLAFPDTNTQTPYSSLVAIRTLMLTSMNLFKLSKLVLKRSSVSSTKTSCCSQFWVSFFLFFCHYCPLIVIWGCPDFRGFVSFIKLTFRTGVARSQTSNDRPSYTTAPLQF